jgi:hypothetical protein
MATKNKSQYWHQEVESPARRSCVSKTQPYFRSCRIHCKEFCITIQQTLESHKIIIRNYTWICWYKWQDKGTLNKQALNPYLSPNSGEDRRKIVSEVKSIHAFWKGEITVESSVWICGLLTTSIIMPSRPEHHKCLASHLSWLAYFRVKLKLTKVNSIFFQSPHFKLFVGQHLLHC